PHEQRVRRAPERPERKPIGHPVLHPRPALFLQKPVAMLPAGVRSPHLHVDEAIGRVPFADECAPPDRNAEPRQSHVEDRAGRQRRRPADDTKTKRGRCDQKEMRRLGEKREYLGARPGEPHARLEDVVGHYARAILGRCPERVKLAPTWRCSRSWRCGGAFRPPPSLRSPTFPRSSSRRSAAPWPAAFSSRCWPARRATRFADSGPSRSRHF